MVDDGTEDDVEGTCCCCCNDDVCCGDDDDDEMRTVVCGMLGLDIVKVMKKDVVV